MTALVIVLLFTLVAVAGGLGLGADSRDPDFSLFGQRVFARSDSPETFDDGLV